MPETAMFALNELESEYLKAKADPTFQEELNDLLKNYVGRPTPPLSRQKLKCALRSADLPKTRRPQPYWSS